jgi:hypothetical protein
MHDSLPLQLFSVKTLGYILRGHKPAELLMIPWSLLNVALTVPHINTRSRAGFLEVGFWVLCHCKHMRKTYDGWFAVQDTLSSSGHPALYLEEQLDHALNTFHSLISILRNSRTRICLNRVGSNPVEHLFGKGRVRCKDVHTMAKLLLAFVSEAFAQFAKKFMDLLSAPRRRLSVGVDCEPWAESGESILAATPWAIAHAIVRAITLGLNTEISALFVIPGIGDAGLYDGLYTTPRPSHMNSVRGDMGSAIAVSLPGISLELTALIEGLRAADLGARLKYAAARLGIRPPSVRQRAAYIEWLRTHGIAALPHIREYPVMLRVSRGQNTENYTICTT